MTTAKIFEEVCKEIKVIKKIVKHGLSYGITFSKEEQKYFNINYEDEIDLSKALIIKQNQ